MNGKETSREENEITAQRKKEMLGIWVTELTRMNKYDRFVHQCRDHNELIERVFNDLRRRHAMLWTPREVGDILSWVDLGSYFDDYRAVFDRIEYIDCQITLRQFASAVLSIAISDHLMRTKTQAA